MRTPAASGGSRYFVHSVGKAFQVLEAFTQGHGRLTLSQLGERSRLNKATARRLARTLCDIGYLRQDDGCFVLAPKVLDLGERFLDALSLPDVAAPHARALAERTREAANLAILDGAQVLYVLRISATRRILALNLHVGSRLPAHATSLGKALLLDADPARVARVLGPPPWPHYTDRTRTGPDALWADLEQARERGCALADGELEQGLRSLAAPVRDASGAVVAALNVSTHSLRVPREELLGPIRDELLRAAAAVSRALGHRGAEEV